MHYYYINKAVNPEGKTVMENTIITGKDLRSLDEHLSYTLPAFFSNKKEMEDFVNKMTPFNVYITQSIYGRKLATQIVVTYTGTAPKNEDGIAAQESKIDEYVRITELPEDPEAAYRVKQLQAVSVLSWFVLKKGYRKVYLISELSFDIFKFLSSDLVSFEPRYEQLAKDALDEGELPKEHQDFIRFMKKLKANFPVGATCIPVESENDMFLILAKGLAAEQTGAKLPDGYGPILCMLG